MDDGLDTAATERKCLATGRIRPKEQLVRFVLDPEGTVVPDIEGRLPGRGMWLSAERDVVHTAVSKGLFSKAARRRVTVPPDLGERIEALLVKRCIELIGLARRAGQAVVGFEKVTSALKAGTRGIILAASDGAEAGRAQIRALAGGYPVVSALRGAELGAAFGRDHAVHALVTAGTLAQGVLRETGRLDTLRTGG